MTKVLTEADADPAGLPRPVSSEGARAHADFLDFGGHEKPANLIRALVSERDALAGRVAELEAEVERLAEIPKISTEHGPWLPSRYHEDETYCQRCLIRDKFSSARGCTPHLVYAVLSTTPESKP